MSYEAVGFDPVNNMLAPIVQTALDSKYSPVEATPVLAAPLSSPWTNYGGTFSSASYQVIGSRVFLRGLVTTPTAVSGPFAIFHLPVNLRPVYQEMFICTTGGLAAVRLEIYPTNSTVDPGAVAIGPGGSVAAGGFVSLSGINFSIL